MVLEWCRGVRGCRCRGVGEVLCGGWRSAPFGAKTVGVGEGFVASLGTRCRLIFLPTLVILLVLVVSHSILLLTLPRHLTPEQRRIVLHRIDMLIQFLAAQEHTGRAIEPAVVEIEGVAGVVRAVETAVPGAQEVGMCTVGVGGEVDDAHFGRARRI
jgi:hypothetical protein